MAAATEARPTDVGYGFNNGLDLNGMMLGFDDLYVEAMCSCKIERCHGIRV